MTARNFFKKALFVINRNPVSKMLYQNEIAKRAKIPLTDIVSLSKHIQLFSPYTDEISTPNDWYGHAKTFKKFLGLPETYQFKFIIEHGLHLVNKVLDNEFSSNLPSCLTHSKFRADIIEKHHKKAFITGPYIHYAQSFYSEEKINAEKKRLGKNIVVFPGHSISYLIASYDNDWLINKIKQVAKDFDSIRICLYWADIQLGLHKYYQDLGFECVTAGHVLDPLFLPRLKSIIEISDLTISNNPATHVSYSTYLNKPHIIFRKNPKIIASKKWVKSIRSVWASKPYQDILDGFSKVTFKITPKQRQIADKYFGINDIKTKSEFKKIVDLTEEIYNSGNKG